CIVQMCGTIISAIGAVYVPPLVLRTFGAPPGEGLFSLAIHVLMSFPCFLSLGALLGCFDKSDVKWLKMLLK
ncbi:MAG: hypothetical protein J5449_09135, partial [Oscillospiraceae bacterium]|nr:hypothetical protein [Oscillospiraceae bacterium]